MNNPSLPIAGLGLALLLSACGVEPYVEHPDTVIAQGRDTGIDSRGLPHQRAAIAYDPDGCQNWILDDGFEGYASPRFDPVSGLPVCNNLFPPGAVIHDYQTPNAGMRDWVPRRRN